LVDILNEFKLSFYLANRGYFIIPDLLNTAEPLELTTPIRDSAESISFIYEYSYLPHSIIPQIMVERHQLLEEIWRTGCVMKHDGCKAFISAYQNRISVTVTGEYKKKREFMAIIRHLLDTINERLSDKPNKLIPLPGTSACVEYEVLLNREKKGKKTYTLDEDKPTEQEFIISVLLDGITGKEETEEILKAVKLLSGDVKSGFEKVFIGQQQIKGKLEALPNSKDIKETIEEAAKLYAQLVHDDAVEIANETARQLTVIMGDFSDEIDDKLKNLYTELKKSDNVEMKLKLGLPLISLLGIDLETKFDIKKWAAGMYKKYELPVFRLMQRL
jgi:hypothetical protein